MRVWCEIKNILPEDMEPVLVYHKNTKAIDVSYRMGEPGRMSWFRYGSGRNLTHWMRLPETPEGKRSMGGNRWVNPDKPND